MRSIQRLPKFMITGIISSILSTFIWESFPTQTNIFLFKASKYFTEIDFESAQRATEILYQLQEDRPTVESPLLSDRRLELARKNRSIKENNYAKAVGSITEKEHDPADNLREVPNKTPA